MSLFIHRESFRVIDYFQDLLQPRNLHGDLVPIRHEEKRQSTAGELLQQRRVFQYASSQQSRGFPAPGNPLRLASPHVPSELIEDNNHREQHLRVSVLTAPSIELSSLRLHADRLELGSDERVRVLALERVFPREPVLGMREPKRENASRGLLRECEFPLVPVLAHERAGQHEAGGDKRDDGNTC